MVLLARGHAPLLIRLAAALFTVALTAWLALLLAAPVAAQTPPTADGALVPLLAATPIPFPGGAPTPTARATLPATPGIGDPPPDGFFDPWAWLRALFDQLGDFAIQALLAVIEAIVWPVEQLVAAWPRLAGQYDFITTTNPDQTYNAPVIRNARAVMTGIANAALTLLTIVAGFNLLARPPLDLDAEPPVSVLGRLALAALAANTAGWWTARLIDLNNALIAAFAPGPLDALLQQVNAVDRFGGLFFFLLLILAMTLLILLLIVQMLMRIVLVNVLLIVAPLALVLLALPQTRGWTGLWSRLFTTTVLAQALQMIVIALATQLGSSLFQAGQPGITLLAVLATLYLTLKLPGLLQAGLSTAGLAAVGGLSAATSVATTALVTSQWIGRARVLGHWTAHSDRPLDEPAHAARESRLEYSPDWARDAAPDQGVAPGSNQAHHGYTADNGPNLGAADGHGALDMTASTLERREGVRNGTNDRDQVAAQPIRIPREQRS